MQEGTPLTNDRGGRRGLSSQAQHMFSQKVVRHAFPPDPQGETSSQTLSGHTLRYRVENMLSIMRPVTKYFS
jgi:hypothetical protein